MLPFLIIIIIIVGRHYGYTDIIVIYGLYVICVTINFVYKPLLWLLDGLDYFKPLVLDAAGAKSEGRIEFLNVEISEKVET